MFPSPVLILADHIETAGLQASILKHRAIESQIIRYGSQTSDIRLPRRYSLVVIDSHYTGEGALAVVRQIRDGCPKPIMLLTYESDDRYHLDAYTAGVDECVVKPLSPLLFLAKIAAWSRKGNMFPSKEELAYSSYGQTSVNDGSSQDKFTLDPKSRQVTTMDGYNVKLSTLESRLFQIFLANQGRILETDYLLSKVWYHYEDVDSRLLTNLVYRLRQKLCKGSKKINHIKSVDRIGYVFE